jgi:alkanesulfonate monooxygenase SsuD/methylene tetrahydromethanopterin reductase-like flavin-dependent oxidoreductase (luciferase family)
MQAGLICEVESPEPHSPDHEFRVFHEALEQIEHADRMGFDSAWVVEHHFLKEFSYSSSPGCLLGAASQCTRRLRLGYGVAVLPFEHPIRTAERVAVLDIVSGGRVEFGTGRGTTAEEIGGFGLQPGETRSRWSEALNMIVQMWKDEPFSYRGQHWTVDSPINVIPKPVQKPHPPLWLAASNPNTFRLAAERGLGVLGFTLGIELPEVGRRIRLYREAAAAAHPSALALNNRVSMNIIALVSDDPREASRVAQDAILWYIRRGVSLVRGVAAPENRDDSYRYLESTAGQDPNAITADYYDFLRDNDLAAVGTPDTVLRIASRYRDLGVDQLLFLLQYGRTPHRMVMRGIELIGQKVIPELHRWPSESA